ncbi:hypothetical protein [Mycobacterium sp.]|nr:hypothetical protein [Mycobacterium sp.]
MPSDQQLPRVYVETNTGGDVLAAAVREALAHLPVRVVTVTRPRRTST